MGVKLDSGKTHGTARPLYACPSLPYMRWPILKGLGWQSYRRVQDRRVARISGLKDPSMIRRWI